MTGPILCEPLSGLSVRVLVATLPRPLGELPPLPVPELPPPTDATLRSAVRDVIRQRGYRPTGRGKPSSEYLGNALAEGRWPQINAVVDAGNVASLRSGLPISVVDHGRLEPPFRVRCGEAGERYVFNAGGQEIDIAGLPCLCDRVGPCANAVKDSQRTKTHAGTTAVLAVVWGIDRVDAALPTRTIEDLAAGLRRLGADVAMIATLTATA